MATLFAISNPCLPGSVVGAGSIARPRRSGNVTEVAHPRGGTDMYLWWLLAPRSYLAETMEWVMAWTDRAMRFCTPTLRINLAT